MKLSFFNPFKQIKKFNDWLDEQNWFLQTTIMLFIVFLVRSFVFGLYVTPTGSMEPTMLIGEGYFSIKHPLMGKIKRGDIICFNDPLFEYSSNPFKKIYQKYVFGPESWTKRVIGIPGDNIKGRIENGETVIYLNDEKLDEKYINKYPLIQINEIAYQLGLNFPFLTKRINPRRYRVFDNSLPVTSPEQPFYKIKENEIVYYGENPKILYPKKFYYEKGINYEVFNVTLNDGEYWGMGDNRQGSFDSRGFGKIKKEEIHGKILFSLFSFDTPNSWIYEIFNPFLVKIIEIYKYISYKISSEKKEERPFKSFFSKFDFLIFKARPFERWFKKMY